MDAQDFRSLQEAYMGVYEERDPSQPHWETNRQFKKSQKKNQELISAAQKRKEDRERNRNPIFGPSGKMTKTQKEQVDIYDIILSHLLDEGYANDIESAEVIMVNMSEEWRDDIVEAKSDYTLKGQEKKEVRNIRTFGKNTSYSKSKATKERHNIHRSKRGINKIKGDKSQENLASVINQSSRVHKSKNNGYNRDGSYMDD